MVKRDRQHLKGLRVRGLTPTGKNWLIQSLDPFHDTAIPATGYPDMNSSNTLIYPWETEMVITAPPSVASGANWDAHFFNLPDLLGGNFGAIVSNSSINQVQTGAGNIPLSLFNVATMPAGQSTFNMSSTGVAQTSTYQGVSPPPNFIVGTSRVVGFGYEVTNTTATNYVGGSVSYYRSPQSTEISTRAIVPQQDVAGTVYPLGPEIKSRMIPNTIADTHTLLNSTKANAADGAYIVVTQNSLENPLAEFTTGVARSFMSKDSGDTYSETGLIKTSNFIENTSAATTQGTTVGAKPINFDTCGAYFTNLPYTTSLNVVIRVYIEYVPTINDTQTIKYSRPSPPMDMNAMICYARAVATLPKGVRVGENPLGEWFARVVDAIGNYGGTVGAMLGPQGAVLGQAASTAAKAYQGIAKSTNRKLDQLKGKENKVARQVKTLTTKVNSMAKSKAKK